MTEHSQRLNAFAKETRLSLLDDSLRISPLGLPASQTKLASINRIRLRFNPTRVQRNRFECAISAPGSPAIVLTNEHYLGPYEFEDHSAAYSAFVSELCRRLSATGTCEFKAGNEPFGKAIAWTAFAVAAAVFATILLAPSRPLLALVQLGILAFYAPTLYRYARRNRSRPFDPLAIDEDLLPRSPR